MPTASIDILAEDLPAMGYRTYWVCKSDEPDEICNEAEEDLDDFISNQFLEIHVGGDDGSLSLKDLRTGQVFEGLCQIVDVGDRGDEYNFTPPENDREVRASLVSASTYKTSLYQTLILSLTLELPFSLTESRDSREESTITHTLMFW